MIKKWLSGFLIKTYISNKIFFALLNQQVEIPASLQKKYIQINKQINK